MYFFKLKTCGLPEYLFDLIQQNNHLYNTRFWKMLQYFIVELMLSSTLFFLSIILEWNKLERKIRQSSSILTSRNSLLKIGRPAPRPIYNIQNPIGLKLLTRLRLGLSNLNEDKFNDNFKDCLNLLCSCRGWILSPISFCTVITSLIFEKPSFMNYNQLMKTF